MSKQMSITLDDWVFNEILGSTKNKSQKIQELIIKGHIESIKKGKQDLEQSGPLTTPGYSEPDFLKGQSLLSINQSGAG